MKKMLCYSLLLSLFIMSLSGCGGVSSSEAKKQIINKYFKDKDKDGYYKLLRERIDYIEPSYIHSLEKKGVLSRGTSKYNATYFYGTKMPMLKAVCYPVMVWKDGNFLTHLTHFEEVPLIKEYFVGIKTVWKDKREGYGDCSYSTYETKKTINKPYYEILKNSGGKIKIYYKKGWQNESKYISIKQYFSHNGVGTIEQNKANFRKNSAGDWRL